jgi:hypothetical protein
VQQALARMAAPPPSPTELAMLAERRRTNQLLALIAVLLVTLVTAFCVSQF